MIMIWGVVNSLRGNIQSYRPFEALALGIRNFTISAEDFADVYAPGRSAGSEPSTVSIMMDVPFNFCEFGLALSKLKRHYTLVQDLFVNQMLLNLPYERIHTNLDFLDPV